MQKRSDTVRALGLTFIATDKPTRARLKQAAANAGVPMTEYLRLVADNALKDKPLSMSGIGAPPPVTRADIEAIPGRVLMALYNAGFNFGSSIRDKVDNARQGEFELRRT